MSETTDDNQKKSKTTEIEEFESLYRNIQNDVARERIKSTGEWYIRHAKLYKILFYCIPDNSTADFHKMWREMDFVQKHD